MIKKDNYTLYLGSMLDVLDDLPENSIDSVVTDPPYEINFMGKGWDNSGVVFQKDTWVKVLRVLKPGGHLLAFNHSRTFHRMAVAIEDAGFQIRDTIIWMYGSGFPKSHNISIGIDKKLGAEREAVGNKKTKDFSHHKGSMMGKQTTNDWSSETTTIDITKPSTDKAKQWDGWGTALKPSYEPIIMARKPLDGTIADNVLKHGVGGINIDECRVGEGTGETVNYKVSDMRGGNFGQSKELYADRNVLEYTKIDNGRFPANTIHDGSDEVTDLFPSEAGGGKASVYNFEKSNQDNTTNILTNIKSGVHFGDSGSAARFFYTAKASKKDRDEGLSGFEYKDLEIINRKEGSVGASWNGEYKSGNAYAGAGATKRNIHPTVKPTDLMQYLVRLVTPKGGKVLDPFMGSGSTGKATMIENNERNAKYHFIGIDLNQEYIDIAHARIEYGINYQENKAIEKERQTLGENQIRLKL